MNARSVFVVWLVCAVLAAPAVLHAQTPMGTVFTYQGRLTESGGPANGPYDFRFSLHDALTGGNAVGEMLARSGVDVVNGLFAVPLDFGGAAFQGGARWLDISVRPHGGVLYTRLSPRQELTPAPYALYAGVAGSVLGGVSCLWQQNGNNIYFEDGYVGIGTTSPTASLHVMKSSGSSILGANSGSSGTGVYGYASYSGTCYGVRGESSSSSGIGVRGKVDAASGTSIGVQGISESPTGRGVEGINSDGGWAGYFQGPVYVSGNLGLGTTVPAAKLDIIGTAKMTGFQLTASPTAGYVLTCAANGVGTWQAPTGSSFTLPYDDSASDSVAAFKVTNTHATTGAGIWGVGTNYGLRGQSTGTGVYGFSGGGSGVQGTTNSGIGVEARSYSGGTALYTKGNGTTTAHPAAYIENSNSGGIAIFSTCSSTDANSVIVNKGTGDLIKGFSGPTGGDLVFKVANDGATTVGVLTITGGSDLAERFDVGGKTGPGMVVMIDPDHPGKLCLSRGAYNRCVAGVVSGANGVDTGMVLSSLPGEDNAQPIALSGRVWVRCEAVEKAIEPGDMLTTAPRPGHAMAVIDFSRAHGAVLGKAMSRLAKGETGLVLALVNLQ